MVGYGIMIRSKSLKNKFECQFTNGRYDALSDASKEFGGNGSGLGPHELVEAAYACCLSIWLRKNAEKHKIPLEEISTQVSLDRSIPGKVKFEYEIELTGPLSEDQRNRLKKYAKTCPVRKTLMSEISFYEQKTGS
jgi:putative redox protein